MAEKFEFNDEQNEKFQFDDDQNKRFQFNDDEEIENSNINNDDIETFDNDDESSDYSNNKKIGELFHFQKGKYELNFCFNIQDLNYYRECHGEEPLKYSVTIFPKL